MSSEISPGNEEKQLTQSLEGESHYHPKPSPDGHWILYGGHRKSIGNLYKQHLETGLEIRLTHLTQGQAAMGSLAASASSQITHHFTPEKRPYLFGEDPASQSCSFGEKATGNACVGSDRATAVQQLPERDFIGGGPCAIGIVGNDGLPMTGCLSQTRRLRNHRLEHFVTKKPRTSSTTW